MIGRKLKLYSDHDITKDTPYLTRKAEVWGVFSDCHREEAPKDNESALYGFVGMSKQMTRVGGRSGRGTAIINIGQPCKFAVCSIGPRQEA